MLIPCSLQANHYEPALAINIRDRHPEDAMPTCAGTPISDLSVRAAQLYLTYLGFHPGPVDGVAGERTLSALAQFQAQSGLQQTNTVDEATVARLREALPSIDDMPNAA
jgi:peptidoglycan hydrolase-like protein with peptidoglycan-binding domain